MVLYHAITPNPPRTGGVRTLSFVTRFPCRREEWHDPSVISPLFNNAVIVHRCRFTQKRGKKLDRTHKMAFLYGTYPLDRASETTTSF